MALSKKKAHKQAIAACLNKTDGNQDKMGSCMHEWKDKHPKGRTKDTMENFNLTFKEFLSESDIHSFVRSLPMYQELLKDQQYKPQAMALAREFVNEFGNEPISPDVQAYVKDELDHLYSQTIGRHGAMVGDWKGEEDYKNRTGLEKQWDAAADKWEREMGTDAVTGAESDKYDDRGRLKHGARSGMDFRPEIKSARIARELKRHGDTRADVAQRAASQPKGDGAYYGGKSKAQFAQEIVSAGLDSGKSSGEIRRELMSELDMTPNGAKTYFYKYKKRHLQGK